MLKKVALVAVFAMSLVAILGGDAEAHLAGTTKIGGYLVHIASLGCGIFVGGVPNPDTNPSALKCTVVTELVEFLCENPASNQVSPGKSARRTVVVGTAPLSEAPLVKQKGTGTAEVHLDIPVTNEDCVNPNWHVIPESIVVPEALALYETLECSTFECVSGVVAYSELRRCVLPAGFGVDPGEVFPLVDTPYDCSEVISREHLK